MTSSSAFAAFERAQLGSRPSLAACSIDVAGPPARSFDLFTKDLGLWWPVGRAEGPAAARKIVIEPKANGGLYEVRADGLEEHWGKVLAFVPARTILLDWRLDLHFIPNPSFASDLEIFFAQNRDGSSHITIIHTRLERLGVPAEDVALGLTAQWRSILNAFQSYSRLHSVRSTLEAARRRGDRGRPAGLY